MQDDALVVRGGTELVEPGPDGLPPAPQNPLLYVHGLLRGRYPLAIALAVIGLIFGAALGYLVPKPEYKSVGVIAVHPIVPKILYQTEQNGIMPMFESYLAQQVALISSRRVTGEAMLRPEWKALNRGITPIAVGKFEENLLVDNPRNSPLIRVTFNDRDPKAAATAVKAVVETYEAIYSESELGSGSQALRALDNRRGELSQQLKRIEGNIQSLASDYGASSIHELLKLKLAEAEKVRSQLIAMQVQLAQRGGRETPATAPTTGPAAAAAIDMHKLVLNDLMKDDTLLRDLHFQKREREREIGVMSIRYGPNHPGVLDMAQSLILIDRDIQNRTRELDEQSTLLAAMPAAAVGAGGITTGSASREQLTVAVDTLQAIYGGLKTETDSLGKTNSQIGQLQLDAADVRERLTETTNRLEALSVEKPFAGRISVLSYGEVPVEPDKDRRVPLAAVGGVGLAGLGVGIVALMGFLDRRMNHIAAAAQGRLKQINRFLGAIPELPSELSDAEQAAAAAHCIHHVRAMLQIRQRATGHKSFAITSPAPGDGKTTLTISLGMALASSGCETLLVDCDFDGGGLSSRLARGSRRQLGQMILDRRLIGEANLQEGLEWAKSHSMKLGAALRELGYVDREMLDDLLREQNEAAPGLRDVLRGASLERAIRPTGHRGMSVLPLGSLRGLESDRLSPEVLKQLLDQVPLRYGVILVDCGPVLGSVEAAVVAAGVDSVILLVSRGSDRAAAERALNQLIAAESNIEGIIFNRAENEDLATSVFGASSHSQSRRTPVHTERESHHVGSPS